MYTYTAVHKYPAVEVRCRSCRSAPWPAARGGIDPGALWNYLRNWRSLSTYMFLFYMYIYIYIHTYTYMYICTYHYIYMSTNLCKYMCICIQTCILLSCRYMSFCILSDSNCHDSPLWGASPLPWAGERPVHHYQCHQGLMLLSLSLWSWLSLVSSSPPPAAARPAAVVDVAVVGVLFVSFRVFCLCVHACVCVCVCLFVLFCLFCFVCFVLFCLFCFACFVLFVLFCFVLFVCLFVVLVWWLC